MPVTTGAKKKLRQDKKRTRTNLAAKKKAKAIVKKFRLLPNSKNLADVYSTLDYLSKKKIYHANKVARLKSRLSKLLGKKTKPASTKPMSHKESTRKLTPKKK